MIEPCYIEFALDGQAFKQELPSRVPGGSVSYALGIWAHGEIPAGIEVLWDGLDMPDEERFETILDVASEAMSDRRLKVRATNFLKCGPEIIWATNAENGDRFLHCLMSVIIPDHVPLDDLHQWFGSHSKFPTNLIDQELQRIQQVRATVHAFGEP